MMPQLNQAAKQSASGWDLQIRFKTDRLLSPSVLGHISFKNGK